MAFAAIAAGMTAATIVDIRTRRIPNELTAALAGIGLGLSAAGVSGIPVWASMLGFIVGLALMTAGQLAFAFVTSFPLAVLARAVMGAGVLVR